MKKRSASRLKLSETALQLIRCPICRAPLALDGAAFICANADCPGRFPVVRGIPVFINEGRSAFAISDFTGEQVTTLERRGLLNRVITGITPEIGHNLKARANYERMAQLLFKRGGNPLVLVIGGSIVGKGMHAILSQPTIRFIESDVSFGGKVSLICDAHDIPFADHSFDAVILQSVLQYVAEPRRCVDEVHRVLKPDGFVYVEMPFIQQSLGRYDFQRVSHLGLRRLLNRFEEIDSGFVGGPGMALAWSIQYFLFSFFRSRLIRLGIRLWARLALFWLKWFDYFLVDQPGALDAASGFYFLGKRSEETLSDRDLIRLYRGAI